ncbi:hypothetical protein ACE1AT_27325 [Pelatocladus sp. BLCC-F211]|uniref:hypothetical protein n=1 Tax=Pelatocladus sp. BLCC-F211 TaxID=3342752 RepID=UPI0035B8BD67
MFSKLVRTTAVASVFALSTLPVVVSKSLADEYRNITLTNNNSQQILAVHIKYPESQQWSSVLEAAEWIERGTSKTIGVNVNQCVYDVKVRYMSASYDLGRYDLCKNPTLTYIGNGGDYSPSGTYIGAKGCDYTPSWGLAGSSPTGC